MRGVVISNISPTQPLPTLPRDYRSPDSGIMRVMRRMLVICRVMGMLWLRTLRGMMKRGVALLVAIRDVVIRRGQQPGDICFITFPFTCESTIYNSAASHLNHSIYSSLSNYKYKSVRRIYAFQSV